MITALFATALTVLLSAGLLHLSVKLVGDGFEAKRAGYGAAVGTTVLVTLAVKLLSLIPVVGWTGALVAWVAIVANRYQLSTGRGVLVFLLHFMLTVLAVGAAAMLFGTFLLGLLGLGAILA